MLPVLGMMAAGVGTSLIGSVLGRGGRPAIPSYPTIDPDAEQRKALAGNESNFAAAGELATRTNTFNQGELRRMLRLAIPNYDALTSQQGKQIGAMLAGELPAGVGEQLQRNAAERAGAGGYGGSGMGRNLVARDMGLSSLQMIQQGLSSAERWMANTKALAVPGQFDVASMFLTPAQRIQSQSANNAGTFNREVLAANVAAAPNPTMNAVGGLFSQIGGSLFGAGMQGMFSGPSTTPTTSGIMPGMDNQTIYSRSIFGPSLPITQPYNGA